MIVKNVEKKEHSTAMFQVEVEAEAFEKAVESAYRKAKGGIYVAGFRKGKAPRSVVEGMYGKDVFHDEAIQIVAPEAFAFGIEDAKLEAVGAPSLVEFKVEDDKSATITFMTCVYPEVTLGEYKGLEAEYDGEAVTDEQVEAELVSARHSNARFVDVERPVQSGDTIIFDFEGFVDGVPFSGGKSEGYTLEIGSGSFIPGFEDQMIGKTIGEAAEINVTFPENYDKKLAGKEAVFKVLVHTIREPQYPELDDEFAKDVSEFDTLDEYKQSIREKLEKEHVEQADRKFQSALVMQAAANMTCDVPEGMVSDKLDELLRSYADSMGLGGSVSREDLLKTLGLNENNFVQLMRPNALMQVQADILMDAIVKAENIEVSQEEKDEFYAKLAEDYGSEAEKVKEMINEDLMVQDLARKKASDLILTTGIKTAPKPEAEAEKPAEAETEAADKE